MIIKSIELADYRNYDSLVLQFDRGQISSTETMRRARPIFLEAIYVAATTKSHKGKQGQRNR